MNFYETYISDCAASAGNQLCFYPKDENEILISRCFFKVTFGGKHNYSFLFSNTVDSTFGDGTRCRCNVTPNEWKIHALRLCVCEKCSTDEMAELKNEFIPLKFDSSESKTVLPAEVFSTNPVMLDLKSGNFLCLEMEFSGRMIPYHEETLLPVFRKCGSKWIPDVKMPLPCMTGSDRKIKKRITFIGDSITQGCGTPKNQYQHYSTFVAENLGENYACWNIGLGYARGYDAATDGAWLNKAKHTDIITVCFGVNDILQGFTAEEVEESLSKIVRILKRNGITVIIQTVPPFDYDEKNTETWLKVNDYIINTLSSEADGIFDTVEFLSKSKRTPQMSLYGSHPNESGHKIWGHKLSEYLKIFINK